MQQALTLKTVENHFLISIDKAYIDPEFLFRLMNRIRLEYLAKKVDFDETIEELGEEIKANWWEKNKERLLKPE
jgi:hypothetical protein